MAAGPETLGLVYFTAVKYAGYSFACVYLRRQYPQSTISPFVAGAVRTLIGLLAGPALLLLGERIGIKGGAWLFFIALIPVRYFEWLFLFRLFYERPHLSWPKAYKLASGGVAWSFVLDIPAIIAVFTLPGGMWIC